MQPVIMDKLAIVEQLKSQANGLTAWFESQPEDRFEFAPEDAWSAGQHLHHLIKSTKPLALGLRIPRIVLLFRFGWVKNPSRNFDDTVAYYKAGLSKGGVATGQYVPRVVKTNEKEQMISRFSAEMDGLIKAVSGWSDNTLDKAYLPHPLLGNLTVREMLYFTIYHMEHHLTILKERYS